jgi:Asp-tRNA(Asn)/Glu-tRNA(Gln) amidotransferase A subunit family amidase
VPAAGLPVGLQLAGRRDGDMALLRLAEAAERLLKPAETASRPAGVREGE